MGRFFRASGRLVLPVFALVVAGSCDKDMSVMLDSGATSDVGIALIDSFTVNTSTVQLDNLPMQATGSLLFGKAVLAGTGSVTATPFFRVGFSNFANDIPENAVFDSLNLVLAPKKPAYAFGDTTVVQQIAVHRVTEEIALTNLTGGVERERIPAYVGGPSIFSKQAFTYESTDLGSAIFLPRVASGDSVNVRLDSALGQTLFGLIRSRDVNVSSNANFHEYFRGLALVPGAANTAVVQFNDTIRLAINYSYTGSDGFPKTGAKALNITQREFQHNHIAYDRSGTDFAALDLSNREIATSATAGLTYVQAGTGTVSKLVFPSLQEFVRDETIAINKAELVIETTSAAAGTGNPVLGRLMLYVADQSGVPVSFLPTAFGTGVQQANYRPGREIGENATYVFNMIAYLRDLKTTNRYDGTSLYLSPVLTDLFTSLNTSMIAIEDGKPKIKLNILHTKFK